MGLPDLWEALAGDCQHARTTGVHNRCAIYYPQLPGLFLPSKQASKPNARAARTNWRLLPPNRPREASHADHRRWQCREDW